MLLSLVTVIKKTGFFYTDPRFVISLDDISTDIGDQFVHLCTKIWQITMNCIQPTIIWHN